MTAYACVLTSTGVGYRSRERGGAYAPPPSGTIFETILDNSLQQVHTGISEANGQGGENMSYIVKKRQAGEYSILDETGSIVGSVVKDDNQGTYYDPWFLELPTVKDGAGEYITRRNPLSFETLRDVRAFLVRVAGWENETTQGGGIA